MGCLRIFVTIICDIFLTQLGNCLKIRNSKPDSIKLERIIGTVEGNK